jgi:hypothetical protein
MVGRRRGLATGCKGYNESLAEPNECDGNGKLTMARVTGHETCSLPATPWQVHAHTNTHVKSLTDLWDQLYIPAMKHSLYFTPSGDGEAS